MIGMLRVCRPRLTRRQIVNRCDTGTATPGSTSSKVGRDVAIAAGTNNSAQCSP